VSTSTVPDAKAGILSRLLAQAGLSGVQVGWAHPGKDILKESVFMGAAEFSDERVAGMRTAPHAHTEEYVVPVWVDVLYEGSDAQTAEARMWVLVGFVEDALRQDPGVGVGPPRVLQAIVTRKVPEEYTSEMGYGTRCRVEVSVTGRSN
jgi:hypothetical protein